MTDQHGPYALIAKAICDAQRGGDPEREMSPEEAKQIAKCIVEALADAGFQITASGRKTRE